MLHTKVWSILGQWFSPGTGFLCHPRKWAISFFFLKPGTQLQNHQKQRTNVFIQCTFEKSHCEPPLWKDKHDDVNFMWHVKCFWCKFLCKQIWQQDRWCMHASHVTRIWNPTPRKTHKRIFKSRNIKDRKISHSEVERENCLRSYTSAYFLRF